MSNPKEPTPSLNLVQSFLKTKGWLWHESHVVTPEAMQQIEQFVQEAIRSESNKVLNEFEAQVYGLAWEYVNKGLIAAFKQDVWEAANEWRNKR